LLKVIETFLKFCYIVGLTTLCEAPLGLTNNLAIARSGLEADFTEQGYEGQNLELTAQGSELVFMRL
jgi:hypothetical protein